MDDFKEGSAAYDSRHKKAKSSHTCSLSRIALDRLPSLDGFMKNLDEDTGRYAVGSAMRDPVTEDLAPSVMDVCYDMSFPEKAVKLFADKVLNNFAPVCDMIFVS